MYQNNVLHVIGCTVDHITYSYLFLMTGQEMYANWKISDALAVWSPTDYQFVNVNFYAALHAAWKWWFRANMSFYYFLNIPISSEKFQTTSYNWYRESVWQLAMGWMVRCSNHCWGEIFWTPPDRPRVSCLFPGKKRLELGVAYPPSSSAGVEYGQSYTSTFLLPGRNKNKMPR